MKYKKLGASGLYVSELVLGTMTFGDGTNESECGEIFHHALDAGVNLIDTADLYAGGHTEEILKPLIAPVRKEILLATKGYFPLDDNPNHRGSSRLHLTQAIEDSLKRLGTDYIDIYYLHRFDENVPLEESLYTMDDAIRSGKVRYLGFSNYAAWQIEKALGLQERLHLNKAIVLQPQYNLIKRQAESEIFPCAIAEGLGVMTYSPLAAGLLTGKYLNSNEGRLATNYKYQMRFSERDIPRYVEDFVGIAKDMEISPVSLAIAWVMANPAVTAPIIGARKLSHWQAALEAIDVQMTPELYTRIAKCTPTPPNATDRLEEKIGDAFSFVR